MTENAFGRLKGRWQCLLKRNDTDLKYVVQQVAACCILHHVCEIHSDSLMTVGRCQIQRTIGHRQEQLTKAVQLIQVVKMFVMH